MLDEQMILQNIQRLQQQFLVHSFLYYVLDESIISDADYDKVCHNMVMLMNEHSEVAAKLRFNHICRGCDEAGSGFYIDEYPPCIITSSLRCLYEHKRIHHLTSEDFHVFVKRYGYSIESQ